jgi:ABC transport system ATP-binding/permease protein
MSHCLLLLLIVLILNVCFCFKHVSPFRLVGKKKFVAPTIAPWDRISHFRRTCLPSTVETPSANAGGIVVLKCDSLTKSHTGVPQFSSISMNLAKGQRVGLIGVNGAGKSTFLKCLAQIDTVDSGRVEAASNANVIYVDQDPNWGDIPVYSALFGGHGKAAEVVKNYYSLMKEGSDFDSSLFSTITDDMQATDGWEFQEKGLQIAAKLGVPESTMYRSVSSLSGGERKRVGLAAALLKEPHVLLLDEV